MNYPLFLVLLVFLALSCLWIGRRAGKSSSNNEDYFLMGRKLGLFSLMMTLLATQVGGGALLGAAEEAYTRGWSVLFYPLGMFVGLLILGLGFGAKIRALNLTTVAEIFEKKYGSSRLRQVASLLSIVSLFCILAGQAIATRKFFLSLGLGGNIFFILLWIVLVLYTAFGGLKAVVNTDILQALFILIAFSMGVVATFFIESDLEVVSTAFSSAAETPWMAWFLMPLLFMLIGQDMGQRCFAAKSPRVVSIASCSAALIFMAVSLAPIYFGSLAGKCCLEIPQGSSVLVASIKQFTNPIVATFLITAILMAIISTADSLLCSISSNLASDFPVLKNMSMRSSRIITFVIGVVPLILSFLVDNVVSVLMFSYELSFSLLSIPVILGVFIPNPKKSSAVVAMVLGGLGFALFEDFFFPKQLLTLSLVVGGFMINEFLLKKRGLVHEVK